MNLINLQVRSCYSGDCQTNSSIERKVQRQTISSLYLYWNNKFVASFKCTPNTQAHTHRVYWDNMLATTKVLSNATKWISASDWYGPVQTESAPFCFDKRLSRRGPHAENDLTLLRLGLHWYSVNGVETSEIKGGQTRFCLPSNVVPGRSYKYLTCQFCECWPSIAVNIPARPTCRRGHPLIKWLK